MGNITLERLWQGRHDWGVEGEMNQNFVLTSDAVLLNYIVSSKKALLRQFKKGEFFKHNLVVGAIQLLFMSCTGVPNNCVF